jgi:hypothetical protein
MGYQAHCIVMEELSRASGNITHSLHQAMLLTISRQHRTIIRRPLPAVCEPTDAKWKPGPETKILARSDRRQKGWRFGNV